MTYQITFCHPSLHLMNKYNIQEIDERLHDNKQPYEIMQLVNITLSIRYDQLVSV